MKSLTLAFVLVLVASSAFAHDGALSLYRDQTITDCDWPSSLYATDTIQLYYVRGLGPEMGNAAQFKIEKSTASALFSPPPVWNPLINITNGTIDGGIAITAGSCLGIGKTVVYLGKIFIFNMGEMGTFTVKVVADPRADPPVIAITRCDLNQTVALVSGGTFVFNGYCNPGVEETSWGAIKSLYR